MTKKDCGSKCMSTTILSEGKGSPRLMVASEKGRFEAGEEHPQCKDCIQGMLDNPQINKIKLKEVLDTIDRVEKMKQKGKEAL